MTPKDLIARLQQPQFWRKLEVAAEAARLPDGRTAHHLIAEELGLPEEIVVALVAGHVEGRRSITTAADAIAVDADGRLLAYIQGERIAIELGHDKLLELGRECLAAASMIRVAETSH